MGLLSLFNDFDDKIKGVCFGDFAELIGFEPSGSDEKERNKKVLFFYFTNEEKYCIIPKWHGGIAQMVERMVRIHEVRGSIPLISTSDIREYRLVLPNVIYTIQWRKGESKAREPSDKRQRIARAKLCRGHNFNESADQAFPYAGCS